MRAAVLLLAALAARGNAQATCTDTTTETLVFDDGGSVNLEYTLCSATSVHSYTVVIPAGSRLNILVTHEEEVTFDVTLGPGSSMADGVIYDPGNEEKIAVYTNNGADDVAWTITMSVGDNELGNLWYSISVGLIMLPVCESVLALTPSDLQTPYAIATETCPGYTPSEYQLTLPPFHRVQTSISFKWTKLTLCLVGSKNQTTEDSDVSLVSSEAMPTRIQVFPLDPGTRAWPYSIDIAVECVQPTSGTSSSPTMLTSVAFPMDTIRCGDNDEVFGIVLEMYDRVTVTVTGSQTFYVRVTDAKDNEFESGASTDGSASLVYIEGSAGQTVHVEAVLLSGSDLPWEYTLDIKVEKGAGDCYNTLNTDIDNPLVVDALPYVFASTVCGDDIDVFSVTVPAGRTLSVGIGMTSGSSMYITVIDQVTKDKENPLGSREGAGGSVGLEVKNAGDTDAVWLVGLFTGDRDANSWTSTSYTVALSIDTPCADTLDGPASAPAAVGGVSYTHAYTMCVSSGDLVDAFKWPIDAVGVVTVVVTLEPHQGDLDLYAYTGTESESNVVSSIGSDSTNTIVLNQDAVSNEDRVVRVSRTEPLLFGQTGLRYDINITFVGPPECPAGEYVSGTQDAPACLSCGVGRAAAEGPARECPVCEDGHVPNDDKSACVACESGNVAAGGSTDTCTVCADGSVPNADKSACEPCAANSVAAAGSPSPCTVCSNYLVPNPAKTSCVPFECEAGQYVAGSGDAPTCEACGAYEVAESGTANVCALCGAGTVPDVEKSACVACEDTEVVTPESPGICTPCAADYIPNTAKDACEKDPCVAEPRTILRSELDYSLETMMCEATTHVYSVQLLPGDRLTVTLAGFDGFKFTVSDDAEASPIESEYNGASAHAVRDVWASEDRLYTVEVQPKDTTAWTGTEDYTIGIAVEKEVGGCRNAMGTIRDAPLLVGRLPYINTSTVCGLHTDVFSIHVPDGEQRDVGIVSAQWQGMAVRLLEPDENNGYASLSNVSVFAGHAALTIPRRDGAPDTTWLVEVQRSGNRSAGVYGATYDIAINDLAPCEDVITQTGSQTVSVDAYPYKANHTACGTSLYKFSAPTVEEGTLTATITFDARQGNLIMIPALDVWPSADIAGGSVTSFDRNTRTFTAKRSATDTVPWIVMVTSFNSQRIHGQTSQSYTIELTMVNPPTCPAGQYVSGTSPDTCADCDEGWVAADGPTSTCTECQDGFKPNTDNSVCIEDLCEPAMTNTVDDELQAYTQGSVLCAVDVVHTYDIQVPTSRRLTASVQYDHDQFEFSLRLVVDTETTLTGTLDPNNPGLDNASYINDEGETATYTVKIQTTTADVEAAYTVTLTLTSLAACNSQRHITAEELNDGVQIEATACGRQSDWYTLDVPPRRKVVARIVHKDTPGGLTLAIEDTAGTKLASTGDTSTDITSSAEGNAVVIVDTLIVTDVSRSYTLHIRLECIKTGYQESAVYTVVEDDSYKVTQTLCGTQTLHMYQVSLDPGNRIIAEMTSFDAGTDVLITNGEITPSQNVDSTKRASMVWGGPASEPTAHFVQVWHFADLGSVGPWDYTLDIIVKRGNSACLNALSSTRQFPKAFAEITTSRVCGSRRDVFSFSVPAGNRLYINLRGLSDPGLAFDLWRLVDDVSSRISNTTVVPIVGLESIIDIPDGRSVLVEVFLMTPIPLTLDGIGYTIDLRAVAPCTASLQAPLGSPLEVTTFPFSIDVTTCGNSAEQAFQLPTVPGSTVTATIASEDSEGDLRFVIVSTLADGNISQSLSGSVRNTQTATATRGLDDTRTWAIYVYLEINRNLWQSGQTYTIDVSMTRACPAGQLEQQLECVACGDNEVSMAGTSGACTICNNGAQPNEAKDACVLIPCTPGHARVGENEVSCTGCSDGHIPNADHTDCVACGPGQVAIGGMTDMCTVCTGGQTPDAIKRRCETVDCPAGQFVAATGTMVAEYNGNPLAALLHVAASRVVLARDTCVSCDFGTVSPGGSAARCTECPPGSSPDAARSVCVSVVQDTSGTTSNGRGVQASVLGVVVVAMLRVVWP